MAGGAVNLSFEGTFPFHVKLTGESYLEGRLPALRVEC